MIRTPALPALLAAILLVVGLTALACGDDDDSSGASPGTSPTPGQDGGATPTENADSTLFVPDPDDPCPRPGGQQISGLAARLNIAADGLSEDGSVEQGVPIEMTLTIINCSDDELEREYAGEQEYDFVVQDGGQTVWRWSDGREFGTDGNSVTYDPGQELTFEATWVQVDSDGEQVPPGEYSLIGESLACDRTLRNCSTRAGTAIVIVP